MCAIFLSFAFGAGAASLREDLVELLTENNSLPSEGAMTFREPLRQKKVPYCRDKYTYLHKNIHVKFEF